MPRRGGASSDGEFREVVGGADHGPFGSDLIDAAEEELAEAAGLFDVSEYGFDGLFSHSISTAVSALPDPGTHGLNQPAAFLAAIGPACAPRRHVTAHRAGNEAFEIIL